MGFTKRSQQSLIGRMPTSIKENERERDRERGVSCGGGGQNANKLCKKLFAKPR
uniref:Uncharacterized protein n=1 Tax=Nelumbo nucifera TaxID=4432 RepID=A0A822ZPB7_NELNU|nr:TPA_asm: hypothetical protein HUJ06_016590 [Nelumbo nucifera]